MTEHVKTEITGGVMTLTLQRPEKKNALTGAMYDALSTGLKQADADACDLVYLADNARLSTPFVNLALVPEAASSLLLPLRIGHARAYAMFALGEPLEAAAALACGLANAVVPQGELRKRAQDAAIALTKRPAGSLSLTKKLMRDHQRIAAQMAEESQLFKERLKTPEAREAFAAFAERRPPDFTKVG